MPADLDREAKKKWKELILAIDPTADLELLGLYCRTHSSLMSLRAEKAQLQAAGTFRTMVAGREGSEQLNPMLREENRLVTALARMLRSLGLTPTRDQQEQRKKTRQPTPAPPGFTGPEPSHGWAIELALCGPLPGPDGRESESDRRRQANEKLLAEKNWRAYERDYDGGKNGTGNERE